MKNLFPSTGISISLLDDNEENLNLSSSFIEFSKINFISSILAGSTDLGGIVIVSLPLTNLFSSSIIPKGTASIIYLISILSSISMGSIQKFSIVAINAKSFSSAILRYEPIFNFSSAI